MEGNRERQHRLSPRTGEQPLTPRSPSGSPADTDRRGFLYARLVTRRLTDSAAGHFGLH
jgi:hypothetical protein